MTLPASKPASTRRDAAHVGQEGDQLVHLGRKGLRPRLPLRVAGEQVGIVLLQHAGAGAGRRDDVVEALEGLDHLLARSRALSARSPEL